MIITKEEAKDLLLAHRKKGRGRFFSALFVKQDKSYRYMLGRFGVTKSVKGTGGQWDEASQALQVWDVRKGAYRAISTDRLIKLRVNGVEYDVI